MYNPLDNFKNPFDIDGEYAKRILNTDVILGNTQTILQPNFLQSSNSKQAEPQKETSFESQGSTPLKRHIQALNYGAYGMECNACCVMYFLQSYGLIPPFMTRKQFEYAFTPLYPNFKKHIKVNEIEVYSKGKSIELVEDDSIFSPLFSPQKYTLPLKTDILDGIFPNTEYFCRGISDSRYIGNAIFPNGAYDSYQKLTKICDNFADLSSQESFKFLEKYKSKYYHLNYMGLKNKYDDLANGIEDIEYFDRNVIFVAINLNGKPAQHYCLVVNKYKYKTIIDEVTYYFYPADDPHFKKTFVVAPAVDDESIVKKLKSQKCTDQEGNSLSVFIITSSFALGV